MQSYDSSTEVNYFYSDIPDPDATRCDATECAEAIEGAIEVLDNEGWIQNDLSSPDGGYCVVGAIRISCLVRHQPYLQTVIWEFEDTVGNAAPVWNDWRGRKKEEVVDALMETAKRLRNKGTRCRR